MKYAKLAILSCLLMSTLVFGVLSSGAQEQWEVLIPKAIDGVKVRMAARHGLQPSFRPYLILKTQMRMTTRKSPLSKAVMFRAITSPAAAVRANSLEVYIKNLHTSIIIEKNMANLS